MKKITMANTVRPAKMTITATPAPMAGNTSLDSVSSALEETITYYIITQFTYLNSKAYHTGP